MLRHLIVIALIFGAVALAGVYFNPYSLHEFVVVSYSRFDTPPDERGVVRVAGETLSFQLPGPTLAPATIEKIRRRTRRRGNEPQSDQVARCVALVRERLNAVDAAEPKAETTDAQALIDHGRQWYCLCSEHALLLNEILQAADCHGRVVWLVGHVANEYFDEDLQQWVYVDPQWNIRWLDSTGHPLSAAQLIRYTEEDRPRNIDVIAPAADHAWALSHQEVDPLWYRNILLNGECYVESASTLQVPSRWRHLLMFAEPPSLLVLATDHDASGMNYAATFSLRKTVFFAVVCVAGFYLIAVPLVRRRRGTVLRAGKGPGAESESQ